MQEVIITVTRILSNQHIDLFNTKLISSCLKQTLTLGAVTPTVTQTLQEADRAEYRSGRKSGCRNSSIVEYSVEGKMKDGYLSKLTITESSNRAIQFKKSLMLYQSIAQTKDTGISTIIFVQILNY